METTTNQVEDWKTLIRKFNATGDFKRIGYAASHAFTFMMNLNSGSLSEQSVFAFAVAHSQLCSPSLPLTFRKMGPRPTLTLFPSASTAIH